MDDLFECIAGQKVDRANPCLIQIGQTRGSKSGEESTFYAWSTGRILASVRETGTLIRNRWAKPGEREGIEIPWRVLDALLVSLEIWTKRRESWAAFFSTRSGYPLGWGLREIFVAPGPEEKWQTVWSRSMGMLGTPEGEAFKGREDFRPKVQADQLSGGVSLAAEIWRVGERQTPPEGLKVGEVFSLPEGFEVIARRNEANLKSKAGTVCLEKCEVEFVAALCRLRPEGTKGL